MKKSWFWLLLLLLMPHLAAAQDSFGNPYTAEGNPTTTTTSPRIELSISPSFISEVQPDELVNFEASDGSGNYAWQVTKGKLSSTQGNTVIYTAPQCADGCKDFVTVSDSSGESQTAEIIIDSKINNGPIIIEVALMITPKEVSLKPSDSQEFKVKNAKGPISWTTNGGEITGEGTVGNAKVATYKAPNTVGKYEVYVTEISNPSSQIIAYVTVYDTVHITPENVILPPKGEIQFRLSGANDNIQWSATGGHVTENGYYIAPKAIGSYEVTASYDVAGNDEIAYIEVVDEPIITPKNSVVGIGGKVTLTVKGGDSPYRWTATDNSCSITEQNDDRSVVTYLCSQSGKITTIMVTDDIGQESASKATIEVSSILTAIRDNVYVVNGQTGKVGVTGGIPPYTWKADKGEIDDFFPKQSGKKVYSAPPFSFGADVITITDSSTDASVKINVQILQPLSITPLELPIKPAEAKTISVVGGMPPYIVTATQGFIDKKSDNQYSFTAGNETGEYIIKICDKVISDDGSSPRCQRVMVYVERELNFANLPKRVIIDTEHQIEIIGGTGDEFGFAAYGKIEKTEAGTYIYKAPKSIGKDIITITDKSGNMVERTINVVGYTPPVISPSSVTLKSGETYIFSASRGVPPYEWSFNGSIVEKIDEQDKDNRLVQITVPEEVAEYTLKVTDVTIDTSQNSADAKINVYQPLELTPKSPKVYKGEWAKIRIDKLGGVGKCKWSSNDFSLLVPEPEESGIGRILKKAGDHIVVWPRTDVNFGTQYTVTCRDRIGEEAQSTITVAKLQNDFDSDGKIDDDEASITLEQFFFVGGIDKTTLFFHLEAFIMQQ